MAQTFTFELVSPEKVLLAGEAEQVQLPGAEGDMTILPGHSPLISTLRPGVIDVMLGGTRSRIFVRQAFAQVEPDRLTVLAEKAQDVAELTSAVIADELAAAESELAQAKTDEQRLVANQAIATLSSLRA
ncbi:MAG: ATP synthase F1 subunit epsilon [Hyphomicrobium sp.]|jgi:F-type H+-transporting ATPase subunit epsilon|uniref:ATP synthase F1 subunit epsilon n=1 Tax=Hyphomicrobium sp. TaxID=82 RepID=UPI0025BD0E7C|nr:ATP synthase F1 subunit epsilon [Hyphomicrobium sp.]MBX9863814.1 ATP synthase F1 subunit epsilon [Hyphomicrobium sp.]